MRRVCYMHPYLQKYSLYIQGSPQHRQSQQQMQHQRVLWTHTHSDHNVSICVIAPAAAPITPTVCPESLSSPPYILVLNHCFNVIAHPRTHRSISVHTLSSACAQTKYTRVHIHTYTCIPTHTNAHRWRNTCPHKGSSARHM
jgi:phosphoribosyl 1,2-cyclic phosphodiesterase